MNAIQTKETLDATTVETVLLNGDLSKLTPAQRVNYYQAVCNSVGLNPLTRPFDYIQLNGKLTLYARKDATDQIRANRHVNIVQLEKQFSGDLYIVTAHAQTPDGRTDASTGAVTIGALKGDARANAVMKAETKAKRRVTLSICGLGILDESEVGTIPDAHAVAVTEEGTIDVAPEEMNQDTATPSEQDIVLINPMSSEAVKYAANYWQIPEPEAAKKIAALKMGNRIEFGEFKQIISS